MKLIAEKKSARDKLDALRLVRADGSSTACALPRQGTLPHDLIHYVVESRLPFKSGFLGLVAAGADAEFVLKVVHDKQNPQVETEAVQVESIVEALQTQLWAGAFERDSFIEAAALATAARGKPAFPFDGVDAQAVYDECLRLLDQWWIFRFMRGHHSGACEARIPDDARPRFRGMRGQRSGSWEASAAVA